MLRAGTTSPVGASEHALTPLANSVNDIVSPCALNLHAGARLECWTQPGHSRHSEHGLPRETLCQPLGTHSHSCACGHDGPRSSAPSFGAVGSSEQRGSCVQKSLGDGPCKRDATRRGRAGEGGAIGGVCSARSCPCLPTHLMHLVCNAITAPFRSRVFAALTCAHTKCLARHWMCGARRACRHAITR